LGLHSPDAKLAVNGDFGIQGQLFTNTGIAAATGSGVANGFAIPYRLGITTLNSNYNYIVRLTTTGTGTDSGSYYLVGYDVGTNSFYTRMVSRGGSSSNHPQLAISGNTMVAYHTHANSYNIRWSCETIGTGDPDGTLHNMGADYQWQRDVNSLYYTDGNVGIGTTSPSYPLHVASTLGYPILVERTNSNDAGIRFKDQSTTDADSVRIGAIGDEFRVFTNGLEQLRIDDNGNVGIGTTSPTEALMVEGWIRVANNTGIKFNTSASSGDPTLNIDSGAHWNFLNTAGNNLLKIDNGGNVGIGTTAPSAKLEVNGQTVINSTGLTEGFQWFNDTNEIFSLEDTSGAGELLLLSSNSVKVKLNANGNSYFNGGNVGIGTTSPSSKLHVNAGSARIDGGSYNLTVDHGAGSGSAGVVLQSTGSNLPFVRWTDGTNINAGIRGTSANALKFQTNGFNDRMTIDGSGNVGIGTNSPGAKLELAGSSGELLKLNDSSATGNPYISFFQANTRRSYIQHVDSGNNLTLTSEYGGIRFMTGTGGTETEKMIINSTGNVGIGTTSPEARLDVASAGNAIQIRRSNGYASIKANSDNSGHLILDSYNSSGAVFLQHYVGGNVYMVSGGGSVGIGTTSPADKLHVNGTVRSQAPVSSDWGLLSFNSSGTSPSGVWFDNGSAQLYLRRSDNSLQTKIVSSGNSYINGGSLGLGTTSPNLKLDVISGANNGIRISATDTTSNWRDIDIRSYVSQAQANALPDGSAIYTTNPASQTETAFSKFGGLVLQGRDDGNSSFAIRLGSGSGYATRMFMGATGATVFSNTVTATNFILSSDERLKENVKKVCDNRVKADWKTFELKADKGQKRYGVIAQELEKTNPEFVREDSEGFKSVAYIDLLIAKIAELETRIQKLEK
jgi:hypothetical protein